ncbi:MAG: PQQ-binding-like beta-propeller repeat protein [Planctomycetota bacterium]
MTILLTALLLQAAPTDLHWPHWRGPTRDGVAAAEVAPPLEWSESKNVRRKVPIDGLGNSTPIAVGERLYLTTAIDLEGLAGPQPGAPGIAHRHAYVVLAIDRATGEEAWRTVVHEAMPHPKQHATGSHASPSMSTDGKHLVASFGSRGLYVLDFEGEVLWSTQLGESKIAADFGEGSTPALADDVVVVQWDEEGPSFVAGFDVATGERRWRREREFDSSWGSPAVARIGGDSQVILNGTDRTIAYDVASGETVWTCGGMSKNPATSPVVHGDVLYLGNSWRGTVFQAIRLEGASGDLTESKARSWTRSKTAPYVPSPIVHDGLLYHMRDSKGVLECVDAESGETVYSGERLPGIDNVHASLTATADRIYIVSRQGVTAVVAAGPEFEVLATNPLDDVFDASPVIAGDALYLRGRSHLYCIGSD